MAARLSDDSDMAGGATLLFKNGRSVGFRDARWASEYLCTWKQPCMLLRRQAAVVRRSSGVTGAQAGTERHATRRVPGGEGPAMTCLVRKVNAAACALSLASFS